MKTPNLKARELPPCAISTTDHCLWVLIRDLEERVRELEEKISELKR